MANDDQQEDSITEESGSSLFVRWLDMDSISEKLGG